MPGEKVVANYDEDSLTMAVAAGIDCLTEIDRKKVDVVPSGLIHEFILPVVKTTCYMPTSLRDINQARIIFRRFEYFNCLK